MQNQLIPTVNGELAGQSQPLVNARELHSFLGIGKDFSTWIKDRIEKYGFTDGEDYSPILVSGKNQGLRRFVPGSNKIEYHLSLDMAKELAMLENNERGRQARRYFIAMEKAALGETSSVLTQPDAVFRLQAEQQMLKREILTANPLFGTLARCQAAGLTNAEAGKVVDKSADAVAKHLRHMAELGLIKRRVDQKNLAHCAKQKRIASGQTGA